MNGRIYDPTLGRFLQADPHIQAPKNSQNYNRYSYVLNNPLSYTDPSGYFFKKLGKFVKKYWRVAAAMVVAYYTGDWASGLNAIAGMSSAVAQGAAIGAIAGGAAGFVATGSLKGTLQGAFSGAVFGGIGGYFNGGALEGGLAHIGSHGLAGGILSDLQGGNFGHGFWSAGLTKAANVNGIVGTEQGLDMTALRVATAAVIGGTISKITGGKFANGATTAAFAQAFNGEKGAKIADRAEKALAAKEKYAFDDKSGNFPKGSYKCNKFVSDMANDAGANVSLNMDEHGNLWPPTAGKWGWGDPNANIPGWEIVDSPLPGDIAGQVRNYSDATGHVGIVVDGGIISARNAGVSFDYFDQVFPAKYTKPVIYRRYVGE